ncbi:MAG: hypothetical protein UV18_C0010G0003 [Candidatus Magasanikbacteria bacterium GW2011_GWC2_42_27]|nr:MAG: hypothetical protein UV18_C0010G0003 [Candidatus Magasanikbacteria bacterium GW2011_GWC2_42_27]
MDSISYIDDRYNAIFLLNTDVLFESVFLYDFY